MVTDEQVATLRALLAGNLQEHRQLLDQLDPVAARTGYTALIAAAFSEAVERRFDNDTKTTDIITFVEEVRTRFGEGSDEVNPHVAELLVHAVLGSGSTTGVDAKTKFETQVFLLAVLIADEQMDDMRLDGVLANARKLGDELMR